MTRLAACYVCEAPEGQHGLCNPHWDMLPKPLRHRLQFNSALLPGVAIFLQRRVAVISAEWRPVSFLPAAMVSRLGQVIRPNGQMAPWQINSNLYPMVSLGGKARFVHKLVAEAFLGPCPKGHEVDHRDRNPLNPSLGNLRYLTLSDNSKNVGPRRRLTEAERAEIRREAAAGFDLHWIAGKHHITGQTARIVARKEVAMRPGTLAKREACLAKNRGKSRDPSSGTTHAD